MSDYFNNRFTPSWAKSNAYPQFNFQTTKEEMYSPTSRTNTPSYGIQNFSSLSTTPTRTSAAMYNMPTGSGWSNFVNLDQNGWDNLMARKDSDIFKNNSNGSIYRNSVTGEIFNPAQQSTFDWSNFMEKNFGGWGGLFNTGANLLNAFNGFVQGNKMLDLYTDSFNFQKDLANKNYANTVKSYNTALEDRIRARYAMENRSQEEADKYINEHKL